MLRKLQGFVVRARSTHIPVWSLGGKIVVSAVRRRTPRLATTTVTIDERGTKVFADLREPFGLALYRYGIIEPEARLVQMLLRAGDVFVDGGAHVGIFTLLAAAAVGNTGRVIACEPVPETMQLLEANVALNDFSWVDMYRVALADTTGQEQLFSFGGGSGFSSFAPANHQGSQRLIVDVTSLDEVVGEDRARVRVVKLDIEGAEVRALRGATMLLREKPDFIVELEPSHLARQGAAASDLQTIFSASGYRGYEVHEDGSALSLVRLEAWERPIASPNIFVSARPARSLPIPVRYNRY